MTNQVDSMIAKVDAMNQKLENRKSPVADKVIWYDRNQNLSERANARLRDIMQSGEPVPTAGKVDIIDALRSIANQSNPA